MSLRDYVRKRRFGETPEPAVDRATSRSRSKQPIFVVQLHHARARHYDFRLEVDGALKSWAVPKGPSLRVGEKRLAVEVEDHPVSYAKFAGDIPAGHYGAGHVDIFDHGTWAPEAEPLRAIAKGHLDFELFGSKLRGRWTLVRTHLRGAKPQWLLLKRSDAEARDAEADDLLEPDTTEKLASRKSTATSRGTARKSGTAPATPKTAAGKSDTPKPKPRKSLPTTRPWRKRALALNGARDRAVPAGFKPQLCSVQTAPPAGDDWLHETKWDGYRLLADLDARKARLRSRNDLDWTLRFPEIARAIEALPIASARLDGELIALDSKGRSDFSALQHALEGGDSAALRYVVFDLPALEDVDLRHVALIDRKDFLEDLLHTATKNVLSFSTHIRAQGERVFAAAKRQGLEGIVSKAVDAPYVEGRSRTWVKVKHANTDEFIVVGYSAAQGARKGFGALLLATVERGSLRYVGRVGTGFNDALLKSMTRELETLATDTPVLELPAHVPFRASSVKWVEPQLVVEVEFRGWAKEGLLRQASFKRAREDKTAEDLGMATAKIPAKPASTRAVKKVAAKKTAMAKVTASKSAPAKARSLGGATRKPVDKSGEVTITHPERIVFPGTTIAKQDVADYYRAVAAWMLPELVERPLSIIRCPDGAGGTCFFQKHHAAKLGAKVASVRLKEKGGTSDDYLYVTDIAGVLELVQMNTLEFHPWGARVDKPDRPDRLVFDLDPGPGVDWKALIAATRDVRARLADAGLESFVRLSGGKGTHVVVPIERNVEWTQAKAFCEAFADAMSAHKPLLYLATASKAKRDGRIFIDWLRNARGATSVASWSLRAREGAPVAMPIRWEELGRIKHAAAFDLAAALRRARTLREDPWKGFSTLRQSLPRFDAAG
jgi:bifunctional non-homologous end joining protein LigD